MGGAVVAGEELDAAQPWLGEELAIAGEGMPLPDMACVAEKIRNRVVF